ncbi:MAG: tRNA modification GTPase [Phycisphaerae bacterium]
MLDRVDDTIVAISSAPGCGQVGIVRLSGPGTLPLLERMARLGDGGVLSQCRGFSRTQGEIYFDDSPCGLPATFFVFRAPNSYTRQDLVEIHTLGAPVVLRAICDRAVTLGAIHAQPGEFTARAFLGGRLSLTQAEGVAAVIRAQTDTQLRAARRLMDGDLAMRVTSLRDKLAGLLALIEAEIDFAEEPIEFISPEELRGRLREVCADLNVLRSTGRSMEQLDTLPHILLLGPPNAGKSTLMNRLSKTDRAICAAVAGTTRDVLAAPIDLGGVEAILLDSAGIDEGSGEMGRYRERAAPGDTNARAELEAESQGAAMARAGSVDVVCVVIDATRPVPDGFLDAVEAATPVRIVVALNKIDEFAEGPERRQLAPAGAASSAPVRLRALGPICRISALRGDGLNGLVQLLGDALGASPTTAQGEGVVLTARQEQAIGSAAGAVARVVALNEGVRYVIDRADLLAFELREAVEVLGTVTGEVSTDDLLHRIFADFCIGK